MGSDNSRVEGRMKSILFEEVRKKYKHCMFPCDNTSPPTHECGRRAIKAHSIQNSGTLEELCEDDHVYVLQGKFTLDYEPQMPDFERVGRNLATTFTGLCKDHDTSLFLPIDTQPLDVSDPEHTFLMTYRSALRGAHEAIKNARWSSEAARRMSEENPSMYEGHIKQTLMAYPTLVATQSYQEKLNLDELYLGDRYGEVLHQTVPLPESEPAVAANAFYSVGQRGSSYVFCALNVFPSAGKHLMLFSYRRRNRLFVEKDIEKLRMSYGVQRELEASRLLLETCETITLKPSHYGALSTEQRTTIGGYFFWSTLGELGDFLSDMSADMSERFMREVDDVPGKVSSNDPRLDLFRPVS